MLVGRAAVMAFLLEFLAPRLATPAVADVQDLNLFRTRPIGVVDGVRRARDLNNADLVEAAWVAQAREIRQKFDGMPNSSPHAFGC